MEKLDSLRQHLLTALQEQHIASERLLTFVESGTIRFHRGTNYDHVYEYTARIILTDYRGNVDAVVIPLLYWLSLYQPELDPDRALQLEAEILDNEIVDLDLSIQLTERVRARLDCETGHINAEHLRPTIDSNSPCCLPEKWQLYVWNHVTQDHYHLVAEWDTPKNGNG